MEKFTLNGNVYYAKDLDFAYLVELDKHGISMENMTGVAALNCFVAFCTGKSEKEASNEISLHIINGGDMNDLTSIYVKKIEESDFFRAILGRNPESETETETVAEKAPKKRVKKTEEVSE